MSALANLRRLIVGPVMLLGLITFSGLAYCDECDSQYFAPDDNSNEFPLTHPHDLFVKILRAASAGGATNQRNMAVLYDAGYLVSHCPEKAAFWYKKAALAGDKISTQWIENYEALRRLQSGPECIGNHCFDGNGNIQVATFYAGHNGHYYAPVTINGVTVTGLVDTGASTIAMDQETAKRFGIADLPTTAEMADTANGKITAKNLILPAITVSGIKLHNVRASIGITGQMLIGMSFLNRVHMRMDSGTLTISR